MADTKYEASCLHCKHWDERPESNKKGPVHLREGVCNGKFNGDYVTANQYCLGFFLTNYLPSKKDKNRKGRKICLCKRCCRCAQQYCIAGQNPKCSRFKSASLIRLLVASVFIIDVATMFSLTVNLREIAPTSCNKPLIFSKTRSIFARAELDPAAVNTFCETSVEGTPIPEVSTFRFKFFFSMLGGFFPGPD